jgi:hypothetical protein
LKEDCVGNPFWGPYQRSKLKFGAALLAGALPSGLLIGLLYEVFGRVDLWMWYLCGCVFYSITVFTNAYIDDGSTLFSASDGRPKSKLALVHLSYLGVLFLIAQFAQRLWPHLPRVLLAQDRRGFSWAGLLLTVAVCVVFFVEESWLAAAKRR